MTALAKVLTRTSGIEISAEILRAIAIFLRRRSAVRPRCRDLWDRSEPWFFLPILWTQLFQSCECVFRVTA